jgi:hypothetical protein
MNLCLSARICGSIFLPHFLNYRLQLSWHFGDQFAAPDIVAFGGGSIVACVLAVRGSRGAMLASWFVLGAAAYAFIGAFAVNWPPFTVPLADLLMAATLASSLFCAARLTRLRHA